MAVTNYGVFIPPGILQDLALIPAEKMLLAAVLPLTFDRPCTARNEHFATQLGLKNQTVSNNLNTLHEKGYIRIFIDTKAGNKREIYSFIANGILFQYTGPPLEKFSRPLYKNFLDLYKKLGEGVERDYRPYIKSLYTLYKNFVSNIKEEEEVEEELESEEEEERIKGSLSIGGEKGEKFLKVNHEKALPKAATPLSDFPFTSELFLKQWQSWIDYRREINCQPYKKIGLTSTLKKLAEISEGVEQIAIAIIEQSISNGWKGLFPLKKERAEPASLDDKFRKAITQNVLNNGTKIRRVTDEI